MSNAWEVTEADVRVVLGQHDVKTNKRKMKRIMDLLDCDAVECAALAGDEIEEQANYAFEEIENQLIDVGIIPEKNLRKFSLQSNY